MSNIGNQLLKDIVIKMRDEENLTFQEIADELKSRYGLDRTRQGISGIYSRAKKSESLNPDEQRLKADIVNLYCLTGSATDVFNQLSKFRSDINYRYVLRIINNESTYIESVKNTIVAGITSKLLNGITDLRELALIEYKDIKISEKKFNEYFAVACEHIIKNSIKANLKFIYKLSGDKALVKELGAKFNTGITSTDLQ